MPTVTYSALDAYLPSRMTQTKMAEVTYTDLNKYVIVHMSKWVDPMSGEIHRVEYLCPKYLPPDSYEANTLEKWQDDLLVETLSARQLLARIEQWKYDPEPAIPKQVWLELVQPTYDVLVQWKENEGDDRHLVEIRKYHMGRVFELMRDRECIYHMTKDMYEVEEEKMNNWLKFRMLEDNPSTEDSAGTGEAKGGNKPGILDRLWNWRKKNARMKDTRSLLMELEALGMSIGETC